MSIAHRLLRHLFPLVVTIILLVLGLNQLAKFGMLAYGDLPPFPETVEQGLMFFLSSYNTISHGLILPEGTVVLIWTLLIALTGGNAILAQHLYVALPLPLAFLFMYVFLGRFVKSLNAKFASALFYSLNPMSLGTMIGGAIGMLYVYAFLPAIAFCLLEMTRGKTITKAAFYVFLSSVTISLIIPFGIQILLFVAPLAVYVILRPMLLRERKISSRLKSTAVTLLLLLAVALLIVLLSSQDVLPLLRYAIVYVSPTATSAVPAQAMLSYLEGVAATYGYQGTNPVFNIINLQWPYTRFGWGLDSMMLVIGIVPAALAYSGFILKDRRKVKVVYPFAFGALFIALFVYFTSRGWLYWLFKAIPALILFPNSANFEMLIGFAYSVTVAVVIESILFGVNKISRVGRRRLVTIALMTIIMSVFMYPAQSYFLDDVVYHSSKKEVPSSFYSAAKYMADRSEGLPYNTIWLPAVDEETNLKTRWVDPNNILSIPSGIHKYLDLQVLEYERFIFQTFVANTTKNLGALASFLNVKYIVLYWKSSSSGEPRISELIPGAAGVGVYGEPRKLADLLNEQRDLRLLEDNSDYAIYENTFWMPRVSIVKSVIMIKSGINDALSRYRILSSIAECGLFGREAPIVFFDDINSTDIRLIEKQAEIENLLLFSLSRDITGFGVTNEWEAVQGSWNFDKVVTQNYLNYSAYPQRQIAIYNRILENVGFRVAIKIEEGKSAALTLRYLDKGNNYEFWVGTDLVSIRRNLGGQNDLLIEKGGGMIKPGEWNTLVAEAIGPTLTLYLNGKLLLQVKDYLGFFGGNLRSGKAGLNTYYSRSSFTNFTVYDPDIAHAEIDNLSPGSYRALVPVAGDGNLTLTLQNVTSISMSRPKDSNVFASETFSMEAKSATLLFKQIGNLTFGSYGVLLSANFTQKGLGREVVSLKMFSMSHYQANTSDSGLLLFTQPYDENWVATANGTSLEHFSVFGMINAYVLPSEFNHVDITYLPQKSRVTSLTMWGASWAVVCIALVLLASWSLIHHRWRLRLRLAKRSKKVKIE